jgi:hypothetical protein
MITENATETRLANLLLVGREHARQGNPKTGETVMLCPEAFALYGFVMGSGRLGNTKDRKVGMELFRKNWPMEYLVLFRDPGCRQARDGRI